MSPLFILYRYLANSRDRQNENNPYNQALRALESYIDILSNLDYWGKHVESRGGFEWEQADTITSRITEGCKTVLCAHHDSATKAIIDFAVSHLPHGDYDYLISELRKQQEDRIQEAMDE